MVKDQLLALAETVADHRVHVVREMFITHIPEGSTVFVCGEWVTWSSGKIERTKCHVTVYGADGELCRKIIEGGKLLVKI
ncbi:hypothetical protein [Type-E symbiont of Plautia stali]|uniref:hypothetical protein n=1 Tax=Type-E symbiont of Plautia stali TaxID=1560357 RepID=UPI00073E8632|nr:hypothetical protein [Type-E symbiont of Plautia stali]